MADDQNPPWHLGQTSEGQETHGAGVATISPGKGDHGGVSYGAYQFSSKGGLKTGGLQQYLDHSPYKKDFHGLTPATKEFNEKWKELADKDPKFGEDQYRFIKEKYYDVQSKVLKENGLDLSNRGPAVQDALWSTSVQFRGLTSSIFENGLEEKFGKNYDLSKLADKDIVDAVQDYKIAHNSTLFQSTPDQWDGLLKRAREEKSALEKLAQPKVSPDHNGIDGKAQNQPENDQRGSEQNNVQPFRNAAAPPAQPALGFQLDSDLQRILDAAQTGNPAAMKGNATAAPSMNPGLQGIFDAMQSGDPAQLDAAMKLNAQIYLGSLEGQAFLQNVQTTAQGMEHAQQQAEQQPQAEQPTVQPSTPSRGRSH
jgi:hypothetical protein